MKLRLAAAFLFVTFIARPQAPAVLKSETRVVIADVVVTDKKGGYVHDLTGQDFKLWDDNREQSIQSFALESAGAPGAPSTATDYLVLAFDDAGMDAGDQLRARQAAAGFIDANAGPHRRIAIASFDGGLRIAQSFTDNAGRLKEAAHGSRSNAVAVNNAKSGTGASVDLGSRDRFQALRNLATSLAAAPGRKTIVLLTGSLVAGTDQKGFLGDAIAACNRANVAVYPVDVRDVSLPPSVDASAAASGGRGGFMGGTLSSTSRPRGAPANGGDVDPAVSADPTGSSQQDLFALANGTGGFVIRNASELPGGLQKIAQEQEEYYVLGFTPTDPKADAKDATCHTLKVKVGRPGVNVRARSSYCTGKPNESIAGNTPEDGLARRAAASQPGNIAASMRLPFFYLGEGIARVNLAMEIQPAAIKFEKKNNTFHATLNILGIASTAAGEVAARFDDTLALDFDDADQSWKTKPVHYEKEFKIAPGQYNLAVVFSAGGESFGKLTQPLEIRPYQPGQFALSGLALGKEIRKDGSDPAPLAASLFDDRTPLKINGVELIPTGSAEFSNSGQAFCYFELYPASGANALSLSLHMRVVNTKTGETAWDGGAGNLLAPAGKTSVPVGVAVPMNGLAPGMYQLQVSVTDAAGHSAQSTADFNLN